MNHPVILFDGMCNLCNGAVNFIIRHDKKNIFRFATLQSATGKQLIRQYAPVFENTDSIILIEGGKAYEKSAAALRVLHYLSWYWKPMQAFRIVPVFLRDRVYDFIARKRYKWFGKKDACMVPTPELRAKFLE